ncbi:hypothetical protein JCM17846_19860 [Iodidimonas nitroreducens]|uniref:DUF2007 domain-containing protein n=1 Tax=Iodidimonas nitroreducens TaxID=1236968 RepID=A0A5A7N964_9PROT|nr:DUF2007 domain-containing protein [Iodidimonas nitroreducens]GAK33194.1 hypothetical protein AQ1_01080 [alpha proteobacterium Q-1]GER04304.1 hypothetical protein JCM17846_19860 [Iodidimonas nitroreducens]
MRTLIATSNPVLLSYAQSLLADARMRSEIFDQHVSFIEGGIGAFPRRLVVADDDYEAARRLLIDADLEADLLKNEG